MIYVEPELKEKIIQLHIQEGRTFRSLSDEFGFSRGVICNWVKKYRESASVDAQREKQIAENVEAMQFLYGVRQDNGNTAYRTANQVESDDQWGMVTSVQVGLLMRSAHQYLLDAPSTKNIYNLLKQPVNIADADLRRLFRIYTTTINLENVDTGALL